MVSVKDIVDFCKDKKIEILGMLRFDPYTGWIDESPEYEFGYKILCDVNKFAMTCVCEEECLFRGF